LRASRVGARAAAVIAVNSRLASECKRETFAMMRSIPGRDSEETPPGELVDPRLGDLEDDVASPGQRSLLAIAGSLLVEISPAKLLFAWTVSLLLPAVLLGLTPLAATAWASTVSEHVLALSELAAAVVLIAVIAIGWIGWRPLLRTAEVSFWSLNALAVQPGYVIGREALRHFAELLPAQHSTAIQRARLRALTSLGAGIVLFAFATLLSILVWPATRWIGSINDLAVPHHLIVPTVANAIVVVSGYLAVASLVWAIADATMDQPLDLATFDAPRPGSRSWRVAHLSDLHVVGERYGFRIESGRIGPRGNGPLDRVLARLAEIDAVNPVDQILISGDMTDAGRATEWAEFLDALSRYPDLAARTIVLPGNHDLNIVDRSNPARLDLPFSAGKLMRQLRALSAIAALQGDRVHVVDTIGNLTNTLLGSLTPHRERIATFANSGGLRNTLLLRKLFEDQFPMIVPPQQEDGLGMAILNSNAETHFSFTNALGLISLEQAHRLAAVIAHFPRARWIIALHHHLVEYPMPAKSFSERIGTALINGSWFVRKLGQFANRAVIMHGHRHVDWIGACGRLKIISAPSPVMGATGDTPTHFYIHTLAAGPEGSLHLLPPEMVEFTSDTRI
jgi:3',5'-cyclic AMP phosphodiesterase CpdA